MTGKAVLFTIIALVCLFTLTNAEVPNLIQYQGKLTTTDGVGYNGDYDFVFRLFEVESGGIARWGEFHYDVPVTNGLFSVMLGSNSPINIPFDREYWLEIQVAGDILVPRIKLGSSPYALHAAVADSVVGGSSGGGGYQLRAEAAPWLPDSVTFVAGPNIILTQNGDTIEISAPSVIPSDTMVAWWDSLRNIPGDISDGDDIDTNIAHWGDIRDIPGDIDDGDDMGFIQLRGEDGPWLVDSVTFVAGPNAVVTQLGDTIIIDGDADEWHRQSDTVYTENTTDIVGIGLTTPLQKLDVAGGLRVGNTDDDVEGSIRYNGAHFQGYIADSGWVTLTGETVVYDTVHLWMQTGKYIYLTDETDSVGIGTDAPMNKFDVEGEVAIGQDYSGDQSAPDNGLIVQGDIGVGTHSPVHNLHVAGDAGIDGDLHLGAGINDGIGFGNTGQVLISDGVGGVQWGDQTGAAQDTFLAHWDSLRGIPGDIADGDDIDTNIAHWGDIRDIPGDIIDGDSLGFVQLRAEGSPWLGDSATFFAGDNVSLSQIGDSIEIESDDQQWTRAGDTVHTRNISDHVGIGVVVPQQRLDVNGAIRVGNTDDDIAGSIRFNGDHFQGYIPDSGWVTLTGGTVVYDTLHLWAQNGNYIHLTEEADSVGIGTDASRSKLDVEGGAAIGAGYSGDHGAPNNGLIVQGDVGIGTHTPMTRLHIRGGSDVSHTAGGYVILGDVDGENVAFDNNEIMARNDSATATLFLQNDGGVVEVGDDIVIRGGIDDGTDMGAVGQLLSSTGTGIDWIDQTDINDGDWMIDATNMYSIPTGHVGIGYDTPSQKLDVNGSAKAHELHLASGGTTGWQNQIAWLADDRSTINHVLYMDPDDGDKLKLDMGYGGSGATRVFEFNNAYVGLGTNEPDARLHIHNGTDADTIDGGYIVLGDLGGENIVIDNNEIIARNDSSTSDLYLQMHGGNVGIGTGNPHAKLQVDALGDHTWSEHDTNPFEIWNGNECLYMGADDDNDVSYIEAVGNSTFHTLNLNYRGGDVITGGDFHVGGDLYIPNGLHDGISFGDSSQVAFADGDGNWLWKDFDINSLLDVDTSGLRDGQVLKWIEVVGEWRPADDVGGETGADNWGTQVVMTDSSLLGDGTPGVDHILRVNFDTLDAHINRYVDLGDLHNVDDIGVTDGEVLAWIDAANQWRPIDLSEGGLGDNWGTQIVETDSSLHGDGTLGDLLMVNWDTLGAYNDTITKLGDLNDVDTDSNGAHFVLGWDHEDSTWKPQYDDDGDMFNELIDSVVWEPVDSVVDTNWRTLRIIERSIDWNVEIPVNQDSLADNSIFELPDVDTTGLAEGALMRWTFIETLIVGPETTLVHRWQPVTTAEVFSEHKISDLSDVNDSIPIDKHVLQWDAATETWGPGINPDEFINIWQDYHGYVEPLTDSTIHFRIYDYDSTRAVSMIDTTGLLNSGENWYGLYLDRREGPNSDGYGIYSHAGTDGGIAPGSEFFGVKGVANGGAVVYGLYGDGDYPAADGMGYGVYGRGKTYGAYFRGTGTSSYGVYATSDDHASGMAAFLNGYVGVNTDNKNARFEVHQDQDGNSIPSAIFRMHDAGFDDTVYFHQKWGGGDTDERALIHAKHNGETAFKARTDGRIEDKTGYVMPVGTVVPYAGNAPAPQGWLICDGALHDTTTHNDLFHVIGYNYGGSGDSFRVPNMQGRVVVGVDPTDSDFNNINDNGGEKTHTLTVDEMPEHNHGGSTSHDGNHHHDMGFDDGDGGSCCTAITVHNANCGGGGCDADGYQNTNTAGNHDHTIYNQGGGNAHNNLQPYRVLNYIIKY